MTVNAVGFAVLTAAALTVVSILMATYLSSAILHRQGITSEVRLASLLVLGNLFFQIGNSIFFGWGRLGLASLSGILQSALRLIIAPILILVGLGAYGALTGQVAAILGSGVITVAVGVFLFLRGTKGEEGAFSTDIKTMSSFGIPVYVGGVISGLAGQYITIILAAIATNEVVGYYQAGSNLSVPISVVSTAITTALLPSFSRLQGIEGNMPLAFRYSTRYIAFVTCPVILFVAAAAKPLMIVLLTSAYSPGTLYASLIALASLPIVFGLTVITPFLNGIGKTRTTLMLNVMTAATILVLAPILSSAGGLGVYGLIAAIAASNMTTIGVGLFEIWRSMKAGIDWKRISAMLAGSALAGGAVHLLGTIGLGSIPTLLIDMLVFTSVYLTCIPLIRGLDKNDIVRLRIASEGLGPLQKVIGPILRFEDAVLKVWR